MSVSEYYSKVADLLEKLRLHIPLNITLPDPVTGESFSVQRENLAKLLTTDLNSLNMEGQITPALYLEAGRLQRAAQRAAIVARVSYTKWKAQLSARLRAERAGGKAPTVAEVEESYRNHSDYERMSSASDHYENLAWFFSDLRESYKLKAKVIESQLYMTSGMEGVERSTGSRLKADDPSRLDDVGDVFDANRAARADIMAPFYGTAVPAPSPSVAQATASPESSAEDLPVPPRRSPPSPVEEEDEEDEEEEEIQTRRRPKKKIRRRKVNKKVAKKKARRAARA